MIILRWNTARRRSTLTSSLERRALNRFTTCERVRVCIRVCLCIRVAKGYITHNRISQENLILRKPILMMSRFQ